MTTPLDAELPPLPQPDDHIAVLWEDGGVTEEPTYNNTADQMRDYARAAIAADRAARQPAPPAAATLKPTQEEAWNTFAADNVPAGESLDLPRRAFFAGVAASWAPLAAPAAQGGSGTEEA